MAQYGQVTNKRQKTARDLARGAAEPSDFFPGLGRVEYRPEAGPDDTLCYRHYNPGERLHGRTMEDWLRPAVSFWHAFCHTGGDQHGQPTFHRCWDDGGSPLEVCKRRIRAAFELYSKLGVKFWTLTDLDVAPEEESAEESRGGLDEVVPLVQELQQRAGVKPLWMAADLHRSPRYAGGAATSSDAAVVARAGAQLKRTLEAAHKLGAECVVFLNLREACPSLLGADVARELRIYSRLLKMTADYKERLGYRGQLLLDCSGWGQEGLQGEKYRARHHYTGDAAKALCFLKHHNLERHYKLSVAAPRQFQIGWASAYGALGSVEATGPSFYGTMDEATYVMKTIIEQGGIQPGGLNIGVLLHRSSTDVKDLFEAYVSCIDKYARGLRNAVKIVTDGLFTKNLQQQYASFHAGFGARVSNGEATLEDCEEHATKQRDEPASRRTEHWEAVFSRYV
ncbi:uncharacterized protein LOC134538599 [Bacillus rossius redtenbacheri]|uniref:uncharacterized protein LOC134538599 n=1 Tax=Bacillus rossius redtenbacheri TaxID=93214 RepID=UPI002FDE8A36